MDECTALEMRQPARVRGFESHPLRQVRKLATQATMDTNAYLNAASERFQNVYGDIAAAVHKTFPIAEPTFDHGMPGFKVRITDSKKQLS